MTFEELVAAARNTVFDADAARGLRESIKRSNDEFDQQERERAVTSEVLARTCSL
jgi:hypothetical protein